MFWFCQQTLQKDTGNHIWGYLSNKEKFPPSEETLGTYGRPGCREILKAEFYENTRAQTQVLLSMEEACSFPRAISFRLASLF